MKSAMCTGERWLSPGACENEWMRATQWNHRDNGWWTLRRTKHECTITWQRHLTWICDYYVDKVQHKWEKYIRDLRMRFEMNWRGKKYITEIYLNWRITKNYTSSYIFNTDHKLSHNIVILSVSPVGCVAAYISNIICADRYQHKWLRAGAPSDKAPVTRL